MFAVQICYWHLQDPKRLKGRVAEGSEESPQMTQLCRFPVQPRADVERVNRRALPEHVAHEDGTVEPAADQDSRGGGPVILRSEVAAARFHRGHFRGRSGLAANRRAD